MGKPVTQFLLRDDFKQHASLSLDDIFSGRREEVENLVANIKNRKSGSILIGGKRGIGKTSLVKKVLSRLDGDDEYEIVEVFLPSTLKDYSGDYNELSKRVLHSLIRSLYYSKTDPDDWIESLHVKTTYKEAKEETSNEITVQLTKQYNIEKNKRLSIDGSKLLPVFTTLKAVGAFFLASPLREFLGGYVSDTIASILSLVPFLFAGVSSRAEKKIARRITSNQALSRNNLLSSKIDLSFDALELELMQYLQNSKQQHIFLLDELDRFDGGETDLKKVVKSLKNLFTTTNNSIFVFVADDRFYRNVLGDVVDHGLFHTIFSETNYITALSHSEIEELIKSYRGEHKEIYEIGDASDFDKLIYYLGMVSNNHPFDLLRELNKIVRYDDKKGRWVLSATESGASEDTKGSLPPRWLEMAALQKFIVYTHEDYKYETNRLLNEAQLEVLRRTAEKVLSGSIVIDTNDYLHFTKTITKDIPGEFSNDDIVSMSAAIEDLLVKLEQSDFIKYEEDTNKEYSLHNPAFPTDEVASSPHLILEYEAEFEERYLQIEKLYNTIRNSGLATTNELDKAYSNGKKLHEALKLKRNKRPRKPEYINAYEMMKGLEQIISPDIIMRIYDKAAERFDNIEIGSNVNGYHPIRGRNIWQIDTVLDGFYQALRGLPDVSNHRFAFISTDTKKFTLFGVDLPQSAKKSYEECGNRTALLSSPLAVINVLYSSNDSIRTTGRWSKFKLNEDYSNIQEIITSIERKLKLIYGL